MKQRLTINFVNDPSVDVIGVNIADVNFLNYLLPGSFELRRVPMEQVTGIVYMQEDDNAA